MTHPSDKILELYLLNDAEIDSQRSGIDEHLKMCSQCRDLLGEMQAYYRLLEDAPKQLSSANETPFGIVVQPQQYQGITVIDSLSLPQRFWRFAKRRPVVTSGWTFALAFFLYAGINSFYRITDNNPVNYRFNEANNMLEIFNHGDEIIWSAPIFSAETYNVINSRKGIRHVELKDLDGDHKNEVITSLDLTFEKNFRTLRVFNPDKKMMFSIDTLASPEVQFRSINYVKNFFSTGFKTVTVNNETNIILLSNNGRSPQFVARIDPHGKILGRYWHYGQIGMIEVMDVDHDGKEEIILLGLNDTPFPDITFSIMAVLDPSKIVGDTESKATRGFGLPPADCEILYARFPRSDVDLALKLQAVPEIIQKEGNVLSVYIKSNELKTGVYNFEYNFLNGTELLSVKGSDPCARIYDELKKEGLVRGTYGDSMFEGLKRSVTYFNGTGWQNKKIFLN